MAALPGFSGVAETGKLDNAYYIFKTGKINWLVLTLEFGPRNSILQWANAIIEKYPQHSVIINTHCYMYSDSTRQGEKDNWRPQAYGVGKDTGDSAVNDGEQIWEKLVKKHANTRFVFSDNWRPQAYGVGKDTGDSAVNDGEQIWEKLVKKHANTRFVFSGHILNTGLGTLISINDSGFPVYQMLANYQEGVKGSVKGGNGWLRIIDMDFKKKTLKVSTYSPYINQFMNEPGQEFFIKNIIYSAGNKN